jgi:hypothetical protein
MGPMLTKATTNPLKILLAVFVCMELGLAQQVVAREEVEASCTSRGTTIDGRRQTCRSTPSTYRAPAGHVIRPESLTIQRPTSNGSALRCHHEFSSFVTFNDSLELPSALFYFAQARSPRGFASGRGWISCVFSFEVIPIP